MRLAVGALASMVSGVVLWRGYRARSARRVTLVSGGATTLLFELADLQLSNLLFKVGDILAAIADVGVDPLLDEGIVGRLPHVTRSGDQGLLPLDLAVDRGNKLVTVHDGG